MCVIFRALWLEGYPLNKPLAAWAMGFPHSPMQLRYSENSFRVREYGSQATQAKKEEKLS